MTRTFSLALSLFMIAVIAGEAPAQFPLPFVGAPRDNKEPEWLPLDPKVQEWCDNILKYWDERRLKIRSLEGKFQMWEYDPSVIPNHFAKLKTQGKPNELPSTSYSLGVFAFGMRNQGLLQFQQVQVIDAFDADGKPKYRQEPNDRNGKWLTNGQRLWSWQAQDRQLWELVLPRDSSAAPFHYLPIPLLFGLNLKTIKDKYWLRPLQAEDGEYCLEFVPKKRTGWNDFQAVQVAIGEKNFLPSRLMILEGDRSPTYPHRTLFSFSDLRENEPRFNGAQFSDVKTPDGWRLTVHDLNK